MKNKAVWIILLVLVVISIIILKAKDIHKEREDEQAKTNMHMAMQSHHVALEHVIYHLGKILESDEEANITDRELNIAIENLIESRDSYVATYEYANRGDVNDEGVYNIMSDYISQMKEISTANSTDYTRIQILYDDFQLWENWYKEYYYSEDELGNMTYEFYTIRNMINNGLLEELKTINTEKFISKIISK